MTQVEGRCEAHVPDEIGTEEWLEESCEGAEGSRTHLPNFGKSFAHVTSKPLCLGNFYQLLTPSKPNT